MTHRLGFSSDSSALALRTLAYLAVLGAPVGGCFSPSDEDGAGDDAAAGTGAATGTSDAGDEGTAGGDDASDGAGGSTGGAADGQGDAGDAAQACTEYCELIGDHCEAELSQYSGTAVCEATCAQMSPGTPDDALGNTVGCRSFHALLAARSPEPHCHHAGPAGDGTCGANCENFCSLALSTCEGDLAPYADADACISACEGYATDPVYFSEAPDADTFACRMRHLTLAAAQPEVHCLHIGSDSPVCVD
jgi:hypothetical protein